MDGRNLAAREAEELEGMVQQQERDEPLEGMQKHERSEPPGHNCRAFAVETESAWCTTVCCFCW